MLRQYNYNLETGTVGTNDENIANILYNINRMEMRVSYSTTDVEKLQSDLGNLFFMVSDAKVHLNRFIEVFGENVDDENVETVIASLDEAMNDVDEALIEACSDQPDFAKACAAFSTVYRKLLAVVPVVLLLDDQAAGRAPVKKYSAPPKPDNDLADPAVVKEILLDNKRDLMFNGYKWRILEIRSGMALILTEEVIEDRVYHVTEESAGVSIYNSDDVAKTDNLPDVTWETCNLRQYLNGEFLQTFSEEQQNKIVETKNNNPDNLWYGTPGCGDTLDKIFLLSLEEADLYFGNSGDYLNKRKSERGAFNRTHEDANGTLVSNVYDGIRETTILKSWGVRWAAGWWLRSPGCKGQYAAVVDCCGTALGNGGCIDVRGEKYFHNHTGIRPALWIDLNCEENLKRLIEQQPDNAYLYFHRGAFYFDQQKWDAAKADFQKAIGLDSKNKELSAYYPLLRDAYKEIQTKQTIEERMAPYSEKLEWLKTNETKWKGIGTFLGFETPEDYADFVAALAYFEEYELLEIFLEENKPIDIINTHVSLYFSYWQPTPLYFITTKAQEKMKNPNKMLRFLVEHGADIDLAAGDGSTPLSNQTTTSGSLLMLETLLELGANPNKISIENEFERTPLIICLLPFASENSESGMLPFDLLSIQKAKLLLEHGADPNLESPSLLGYSPLVMAIRYGFPQPDGETEILELIELMLNKGADPNYTDNDGNTPLWYATEKKQFEVEKLLLQYATKTLELIPEKEMQLTWNNDDAIAQMLLEKYPEKPPVAVSDEKLCELVIGLENFKDAPQPPDDIYLDAIQHKWIMLWHGPDAKKSFRGRPDISEDD